MTVAAVTGLAAEARIAQRLGLRAAPGGGTRAGTEAATRQLIAAGATALVSFGIAGGLATGLAPGTLVVAEHVIDPAGSSHAVDRAWRAQLLAALAGTPLILTDGAVSGADAVIADAAAKAAAFRRSGAVAVDMESHIVARAAIASRLPFLVLRAIADPAERSLPSAALVGLNADGGPAFGAVLISLARRPAQLRGLLRVALDARRALTTLDALPAAALSPWPRSA